MFHIGLEDMEPGNWVAWVFELPGCYARASVCDKAVDLVPTAIEELLTRLKRSGFLVYDARPSLDFAVTEEFRAFQSSPDYLVNAFFEDDKIPLTERDIEYARCLLGLNRDELFAHVLRLSQDTLDRLIPGEVQKNIGGILRHIGTAEWWYWDRLGLAFSRSQRPDELFELLNMVREFTLKRLPELVDYTKTTVCSGEQWSPRKLLRRAIWHERVHTLQIARYLQNA